MVHTCSHTSQCVYSHLPDHRFQPCSTGISLSPKGRGPALIHSLRQHWISPARHPAITETQVVTCYTSHHPRPLCEGTTTTRARPRDILRHMCKHGAGVELLGWRRQWRRRRFWRWLRRWRRRGRRCWRPGSLVDDQIEGSRSSQKHGDLRCRGASLLAQLLQLHANRPTTM